MKPINIFRAGTHTTSAGQTLTFSDDDVRASAEAYDPALHEAPIVVGHPATDAPAYGWVKELAFGDGGLDAVPDQVDPSFAELVQAGRYKKISAAFFKPGAANNPAGDVYYLRHVGFLGAAPPAVKGLKQVAFADDDELVTIEFGDIPATTLARVIRGLRDWMIEKFGAEDADKALPGHDVDFIQEQAARPGEPATSPAFAEPAPAEPEPTPSEKEVTMSDAEIAAKEAAVKTQETEVKAKEEKLARERAEFEEDRRKAEAEALIEAHVAEGRVLPAEKDAMVKFMAALDATATVEFAEGDAGTMTPRDFFDAHLGVLPNRVDFSERAGGDGGEPVDVADPDALADAAVAFQAEQGAKGITISIDKAVRHVAAQNKEART